MTDAPNKVASGGLFARLPVGRSDAVRILMIVGAVLTAACLVWIRHLRFTGDYAGLAPIFYVLFTYYDYGAAMLALGILLMALFAPQRPGLDRLLRWLGEHPVTVAAVVTALLSLGAIGVYRNQPLSMDEYAAVFQSQVFASGHLSGKLPLDLLNYLIPEAFQNFFLNTSKVTGEVSSSYWPSFSLLLTPFTLLGIPWACNPVLTGLTVIVLNRLALRLFGSAEAAGTVTLLTLASPVIFANGISYYSMTAHMLANALFALLVLQPTARRLFIAGVVGSIALTLHNPVPHLLFALPWFVWLALQPKPVGKIAVLCAGYLPLCILLGIGWFMHSNELKFGGATLAEGTGGLGGLLSAFAWPSARLGYARLIGLTKLLLWAAPCVLLLAFAGAARVRRDSRFVALIASALLTFIGYLFFVADQGHGWGFRYFHSAWLVLPLLATAFLYVPANTPAPAVAADADVRTYVMACAVLSLFAAVGLRAVQIREFMDGHLSQLPEYAGTEPRVTVIKGYGFYPYDLVQNDPFLRTTDVRVVEVGEEETAAAIQRHFPGYHIVYRDDQNEVWSEATPQPLPPKRGSPGGPP